MAPVEFNLDAYTHNISFGVTVSGSFGWNCLIKGIPIIVFGKPWYSGVHGCTHFDQDTVYRKMLEILEQHPSRRRQSILNSVKQLKAHVISDGIPGTDRVRFLPKEIDFDENVSTIVSSIQVAYG